MCAVCAPPYFQLLFLIIKDITLPMVQSTEMFGCVHQSYCWGDVPKVMTYVNLNQNLASNFQPYFMFKIGSRLRIKKLEQRSLPQKILTLQGELSNWQNSYLFLRHRRKTPFKDFSEPVPTDLKFVKHCCFGEHKFTLKTISEWYQTTF